MTNNTLNNAAGNQTSFKFGDTTLEVSRVWKSRFNASCLKLEVIFRHGRDCRSHALELWAPSIDTPGHPKLYMHKVEFRKFTAGVIRSNENVIGPLIEQIADYWATYPHLLNVEDNQDEAMEVYGSRNGLCITLGAIVEMLSNRFITRCFSRIIGKAKYEGLCATLTQLEEFYQDTRGFLEGLLEKQSGESVEVEGAAPTFTSGNAELEVSLVRRSEFNHSYFKVAVLLKYHDQTHGAHILELWVPEVYNSETQGFFMNKTEFGMFIAEIVSLEKEIICPLVEEFVEICDDLDVRLAVKHERDAAKEMYGGFAYHSIPLFGLREFLRNKRAISCIAKVIGKEKFADFCAVFDKLEEEYRNNPVFVDDLFQKQNQRIKALAMQNDE